MSKLYIVGTGPGDISHLTEAALPTRRGAALHFHRAARLDLPRAAVRRHQFAPAPLGQRNPHTVAPGLKLDRPAHRIRRQLQIFEIAQLRADPATAEMRPGALAGRALGAAT